MGRGIGMVVHEMVQHMEQNTHMVPVAPGLRCADIIDDHSPDRLIPVRLMRQVVAIGSRHAFRHMFVLGDRENLLLAEITHADNIIERYHHSRKP